VTFLFTDIEGSTNLWERRPDAMRAALAEHDRRLREAIRAHDGYVFATGGDSFAVAFETASAAVAAAVQAQLALQSPAGELTLAVRMGLHTGAASVRDGDYFGPAVNRAARLMSAAHGGQILLSRSSARALGERPPAGVTGLPLGVHRLKDLSEPEEIQQVLHPQLRQEFPQIRTLADPGKELPVQLTSFVGRERETEEVCALLGAHRLVTLTGLGGTGKTRLALQVAAELAEGFPDGIHLVELAALADGDIFADEVADRLGVRAVPGVPLLQTLSASVAQRRILLLLDNCEHILEPVAALAHRMLRACPGLRILATSRELLGVDGEALYRLAPLALPSPGLDPAQSLRFGSVRLFLERARLAGTDFQVTSVNVEDVIAICRRLDGIPLAIELAAARVRSMSAEQIARRLGERFKLLAAHSRSRSKRQQTLLAAIDWSHDLLGDSERVAFRRLSSFASAFTLEAAEQVCAGNPVEDFEVVDLLAALVDKSMVVPVQGQDGSARYLYLESMREYGQQRLQDSGEAPQVAERSLAWHAARAEALQARQRRGELAQALQGRQAEEDNLRGALRMALDSRQAQIAGRIVAALGYLWYAAGLHREGIQWCEELFAQAPVLPDEIRAGVLHSYGTLLGSWKRPDKGAEILAEQVEIRRRLGNPARLGAALNNLGNLQQDMGNNAAGEASLAEAVVHFRAAGESAALSLVSLADGHLHAGDHARALALCEEAFEDAARARNAYGQALAGTALGRCAFHRGDLPQARVLLEEARAAFQDLQVTPGVAWADLFLALVGAVSARYASSAVVQPAFILADLQDTRTRLSARLGQEALERGLRAGAGLETTDAARRGMAALRVIESACEQQGNSS
jgi:predicted ATPase/class 3 adenylate cyclase